MTNYVNQTQHTTALAGKEDAFTKGHGLALTSGTLDVVGKQDAISVSAPVTLSGTTIGVDLSAYTNTTTLNTLLGNKMDVCTTQGPLSLTNNVLSINLSNYATQAFVTLGLAGKEDAFTKGHGLALTSVTLDVVGKQGTISVSAPVTLSGTTIGVGLSAYTNTTALNTLLSNKMDVFTTQGPLSVCALLLLV